MALVIPDSAEPMVVSDWHGYSKLYPHVCLRGGRSLCGPMGHLRVGHLGTVLFGGGSSAVIFNDDGQVVWLATFTDETTAIITTEVS